MAEYGHQIQRRWSASNRWLGSWPTCLGMNLTKNYASTIQKKPRKTNDCAGFGPLTGQRFGFVLNNSRRPSRGIALPPTRPDPLLFYHAFFTHVTHPPLAVPSSRLGRRSVQAYAFRVCRPGTVQALDLAVGGFVLEVPADIRRGLEMGGLGEKCSKGIPRVLSADHNAHSEQMIEDVPELHVASLRPQKRFDFLYNDRPRRCLSGPLLGTRRCGPCDRGGDGAF